MTVDPTLSGGQRADSEALKTRSPEKLRNKRWRTGYAEGWKIGYAEGLREGRVLALLDLIRLSLGDPSPALTTRVTAEAGQNPGPWLDRVLAATSLADLEPAGG